jgi:lipooligosaccharide transport system permease protein
MNAATFEALYSAFSRMHVQKTWEAILNTPLGLADVVAGELFWAATKSLFSGAAILLVITAHGAHATARCMLWALPAIVLTGLAFAALGLIWNALAPSYDFFMYYFTLFITPMTLISGVFFPTDQLPGWLAAIGSWLPLAQGVALVRPLLAGQVTGRCPDPHPGTARDRRPSPSPSPCA